MPNVLTFYSMKDLLAELRGEYTLQQLAEVGGVTHQAISLICKENPHWVYKNVKEWKKGLRLKRVEGQYFELLAVIAAYPHDDNKTKLMKRAFHLAGRLEEHLNTERTVASSLVYWLDPVCSMIRNGTDLAGFPVHEDEIPQWISGQVKSLRSMGMTRAAFKTRVANAWSFLVSLQAVSFNKRRKRWEKSAPLIVSEGKATKEHQKSIQSVIFPLVLNNYFEEFIQATGTDQMIVSKYGNFALPRQHFNALYMLLEDFIIETVQNFNYISNGDDLKRLEKDDPEYFAKVLAYKKKLKKKGIELEPLGDQDMDSMVQMIVAARRMLP